MLVKVTACFVRVALCFMVAVAYEAQAAAQDTDDGGVTYYAPRQEVLESIFVPFLPGAPFSLVLDTEWVRFLKTGGTYTVVNRRPIRRDSQGRIYEERWLLSPKGSRIPSRMSWIQIADQVDHKYYECNAMKHICELRVLRDDTKLRLNPEKFKSGTLQNGKGNRTHEDLGTSYFAGVAVHEYRDTTTLNAGAQGNDVAMSVVRHFRFSAELGFNLYSEVENPLVGRQVFTVAEVSTTEPDAHYFLPPEGYQVVDMRKKAATTD